MQGHYAVIGTAVGDVSALREVVDAVRDAHRSELAHCWSAMGFRFIEAPGEMPSLDHVMLNAWSTAPSMLDALREALDDATASAVERWHLRVEATRVQGSHEGFAPDTGAALSADEPAVIQIHGVLTPAGAAPFLEATPGAIAQANAHPGYLGGLAFTETLMETTSFSCWRTYDDARTYGFRSGAHDDARRLDRSQQWHDPAVDWFMRLRPLSSKGSLFGADPLAGVLG